MEIVKGENHGNSAVIVVESNHKKGKKGKKGGKRGGKSSAQKKRKYSASELDNEGDSPGKETAGDSPGKETAGDSTGKDGSVSGLDRIDVRAVSECEGGGGGEGGGEVVVEIEGQTSPSTLSDTPSSSTLLFVPHSTPLPAPHSITSSTLPSLSTTNTTTVSPSDDDTVDVPVSLRRGVRTATLTVRSYADSDVTLNGKDPTTVKDNKSKDNYTHNTQAQTETQSIRRPPPPRLVPLPVLTHPDLLLLSLQWLNLTLLNILIQFLALEDFEAFTDPIERTYSAVQHLIFLEIILILILLLISTCYY